MELGLATYPQNIENEVVGLFEDYCVGLITDAHVPGMALLRVAGHRLPWPEGQLQLSEAMRLTTSSDVRGVLSLDCP